MPIYEYKCPSCGHLFEVLRKASDSPDGKCPKCETQSKRVYHPVGVIFKGSGFYSTDSKKKAAVTSSSGKDSSSTKESSREQKESSDPVVQKRIDTA